MIVIIAASAAFAIGLYTMMSRRDVVAVLAGVELSLGGANVLLVACAAQGGVAGAGTEAIALMVIVIAAAEASVGLALLVTAFKRSGRSRMDEFTEVKG